MSVEAIPVTDEFRSTVASYLSDVERSLQEAALANSPFVSELARHIIDAGGKRFRPMLVVLAALIGQSDRDVSERRLIDAALVVELTHVASLYHDDVMDDADTRRGAPSANRRWSNSLAILVGDYLFSRASSIVADLGTDFVKLQADTFARLVQGQIAETRGPGESDPLQYYLDVIADKTGSLIATSAVFGGMIGGCTPSQLSALETFGEQIGIVFQLSDDIIDIDSDTTGKTPGTDLREGVPTLPTLLLRAGARTEDRELLDLLDSDLADDERLGQALALLRAHPVMDEARDEVARRAGIARDSLSVLPECEAKLALESLCDQVVNRSA